MTAIETHYNGRAFRSRIEARWAVVFDALGIRWHYEHEGYDLAGLRYLPDFWLPDMHVFVEIKGDTPSENDLEKCKRLAVSVAPVLLCVGDIDRCLPYYVNRHHEMEGQSGYQPLFTRCSYCGVFCLVYEGDLSYGYHHEAVTPCRCQGRLSDNRWMSYTGDCARHAAEVQTARARGALARFEHGETPRVHHVPAPADPGIPSGAMLTYDFGAAHGVPRRTIIGHVDSQKISETTQPIASLPDRVHHFLTLEQQGHAVAFWRDHYEHFTPCDHCPHER